MQTCSCGAVNPDQAKFCEACGAALGPEHCPSCHAELPRNAHFCTACGEPIASAPASPSTVGAKARREPWGMWGTLQPITSLAEAKGQANIGARSCMFAALFLGLFGFVQWHGGLWLPGWDTGPMVRGSVRNLYLAALSLGCALGFYRRSLAVAHASFALFGLVLLVDVIFPLHQQSLQEWTGWFMVLGLAALWLSALIAGLRGCRALAADRTGRPLLPG